MTIEIKTMLFGLFPVSRTELMPGEKVPFVRRGSCRLQDDFVPKAGELMVVNGNTVRLPGGELVSGGSGNGLRTGDQIFRPVELRRDEINMADLQRISDSNSHRQGVSVLVEKIVWRKD
ncbi:hypothetical protein HYU92_04830 [Candidatus Curtissbacteria bacterium]|nr:hypothetical protein [Candidatus Curtissbacteria bacterium]